MVLLKIEVLFIIYGHANDELISIENMFLRTFNTVQRLSILFMRLETLQNHVTYEYCSTVVRGHLISYND